MIANGLTSYEGLITCGVPHGSTLGPLLFVTYINDINKYFMSSKITLFADDTVLYTSSTSVNTAKTQLQIDLETLDTWCNQHKLLINTNKTKIVLFGNNKFDKNIKRSDLTIAGDKVHFVNDYEYSGIVLDKKHFIY